ncbi:MAG TPA: alpha/beta hydrolase [Steroidobacteraceae bacterium]|jgi:acetyl esterase/lipase
MTGFYRRALTTSAALMIVLAIPAHAQAPAAPPTPDPLRAFIPSTLSPEAAAVYAGYRAYILALPAPPPKTLADFDALYQKSEERSNAVSDAAVKRLQPMVIQRTLAGVTVYEVHPKDYRDDGTLIIDVHGGGFVLGSAKSSVGGAAETATATGKRVLTVDYTVAPRGRWQLVTDQVTGVYKALLDEGIAAKHIGMTGGSAGGNIVAASVLKIRDRGLPMPAALLLVSPMTDFTPGGDTRKTLAEADPALHEDQVRPGLDAYADPADQKNPYVSPVYGDFTKGYPPVLIQGGTKEILLSDMVRLNRAIKAAGGNCDLEIYEGMPHGFPGLFQSAPEGKEAKAEEIAFWHRYLPSATR